MKIGLYFGSFNPVHIGHLIIANHVADNTDLKQVWFVVSPQNPLKNAGDLLNENHRLHLIRLCIEDNKRLRASNVEFGLPKPSYTINTLTYLSEKYPDNEFVVILGSDSFCNLPKWKNYKQLIEQYKIIIYKRRGAELDNMPATLQKASFSVLNAPLLEISSTMIRGLIKKGKSIHYLVPDKAREEIQQFKYYRK